MRKLLHLDATMAPRRALLTLGLAALAAVGLTFGIQASAQQAEPEGPPEVADVVWDFRPDSVGELARGSRSMVFAEVTGVRDGEPLVADADGHPDGAQIPTQRIAFQKVRDLEGEPMPETFDVFRTGSEQVQLANDPPYEVGQRYVLFVESRGAEEPGTYLPAAPDGRLLVEGGELDALIEGPVAQDLEGDTPAEADSQVEQETSR